MGFARAVLAEDKKQEILIRYILDAFTAYKIRNWKRVGDRLGIIQRTARRDDPIHKIAYRGLKGIQTGDFDAAAEAVKELLALSGTWNAAPAAFETTLDFAHAVRRLSEKETRGKPQTKADREKVSMKISHLMKKEGKTQDQAVAQALSMWRRGEL